MGVDFQFTVLVLSVQGIMVKLCAFCTCIFVTVTPLVEGKIHFFLWHQHLCSTPCPSPSFPEEADCWWVFSGESSPGNCSVDVVPCSTNTWEQRVRSMHLAIQRRGEGIYENLLCSCSWIFMPLLMMSSSHSAAWVTIPPLYGFRIYSYFLLKFLGKKLSKYWVENFVLK